MSWSAVKSGVGKTSLIGRFREIARGRSRVLSGAFDALSTPRPLGPLLDIAAEAGGELDRLLTEGAARDRVFRAALNELSEGLVPTLAVVEDAHWADEATLDFLRFLGRRVESSRALVVVTYRDDEVGPRHPLRLVLGDLAMTKPVRRLELAPLSETSIRTLVAGSGVNPASLYRLTGGNPFFASEVIASGAAARGGVLSTVRDAVLTRASRLSPPARMLLEVAAVVGPAAETAVLPALATFERLGARPMTARTSRRLRELGVRAVPRGPRPTTRAIPANLTEREVEVLALIVAGCRNAEIADRLFLSPKTVEHHVGNVFAKLGVHTRHEAIAAAARLGISTSVEE